MRRDFMNATVTGLCQRPEITESRIELLTENGKEIRRSLQPTETDRARSVTLSQGTDSQGGCVPAWQ